MSRLDNHNRLLDISKLYGTPYAGLPLQQQEDVLTTLSSVEQLFSKQPFEAGTTEHEMLVAAVIWQLQNECHNLHHKEMATWLLRNQLSKVYLDCCLHGGISLYWEGVQLCTFKDADEGNHFMNLHHFKVTGIEVDCHFKLTMTFSD